MNDPECTVCQNTGSPHGVPPVTVQTPGRAAYEAYIAALGWITAVRWQDADDAYRAAWEAVAQAVLAAVTPTGADTPGRAAFEAYSVAESGKGLVSIPWDEMPDSVHSWWETAASASVAALRSDIGALLADVAKSAEATRPSRKTEVEDEFAIALRRLLEEP